MTMSRRAFCLLAPAALAGCTIAPRARADTLLYAQVADPDAAHVGLGFYSSSQPRPTRNHKHADDFTLVADAQVTRVRWWGLSEGRLFDDLRNFDQYTIEVFEGSPAPGGPLPGTPVGSAVFAAGDLSITATGRASRTSGAAEFLFDAALPTPITLRAGRPYLIAISARCIDPRGDAWQWQDGTLAGGHSANYSYAARAWSAFEDTDSAFELLGTPVPAPGAAVTLLAALAAGRRARAGGAGRTPRA
jgi:hypothetical protein